MRERRNDLAKRWLDRIADRVSLDPNHIFPSTELLDHVPLLIVGMADYLEDPVNEVSADMPVVAKAMELGALRHAQGFDAYQILKEYEILGGIIFADLAAVADEIEDPCTKSELLYCGQRLFRAVALIQQATTMHFLRLGDQKVSEREERIRAFNRSVSHEIKNRIGAILGASSILLELPDIEPPRQRELLGIVSKNAKLMARTVENLIALSRTEHDVRHHRHVVLAAAAREAARQIRETAEEADVRITIADDMPEVEVNAAAVELILANYLSNAIKYADGAKPDRCVEITGAVEPDAHGGHEVVVRVRDNGVGVPPDKRDALFQRFFRGHEGTDIEGAGLGLSIVAETAESLGGRTWAEFLEDGSVFAFSLPARREGTAEAPGPSGEPGPRGAADNGARPT